jgi:hypothetical protein
MRNALYPDIPQSKPNWLPIDNVTTGQNEIRSFDFFEWWHRLTTPVGPPVNASFTRRDHYRQAHVFSNVAFFLIAVLAFSIPVCLFSPSPYMLYIACAEMVISCICLLLNRMGKIMTAGIVQVVSFEVILTSVILIMAPLNGASIQILDLFIIGELLAATLLPVRYMLLVALYNSLFIWLNISASSNNPEMILPLLIRTVGLQFMVAGITSIYMHNTTQAIISGDQAETLAMLEHTLIEQRKELETGIEQILQTHVAVANGNPNVRVPLAQDHMLWQIARAFNNLLVRFQRALVSERELQRVEDAVTSTVNIIQKSAQQRQQVHIPFTHTAIDPLIASIQGKTFAFTRSLRQVNISQSTDPVNVHTVDAKISPRHVPP